MRVHDLSDITFIIPFSFDLPERLRNLRIVTQFLTANFNSRIIVSEYDTVRRLRPALLPSSVRRSVRHLFFRNPNSYFQRTRSVNLACSEVDTPLLAVCDADVLLMTAQYVEGVTALREGRCDMCLPFENRVMWIPRDDVPAIMPVPDDRMLSGLSHETSDDSHVFFGLICLLNTQSFLDAGMMNEHFKSWGYEEMEFHMRLLKLGYRIRHTGGLAYHLGHGNGGDTGPEHEHYTNNMREYHRVLYSNVEDLHAYIASWPWAGRGKGPKPQ